MPIYEYEHDREHCDECGERFEVLQGMNEPPLTRYLAPMPVRSSISADCLAPRR